MAITLTWHPHQLLEDFPVLQVYVFALTPDKKLILVRDSDEERFTLPGGGVEGKETALQAALRELREEAQVGSAKTTLLGSLEVEDPHNPDLLQAHHHQARFVCHIQELNPFTPNKDGFETAERIVVEPEKLSDYIP